MVTTQATIVLLFSGSLVHHTLSHRDPDGRRSQSGCGSLAPVEEKTLAKKGIADQVERIPAPMPSPAYPLPSAKDPASGQAMAAGGQAMAAGGTRGKGESGIQLTAKHGLAVQRGTILAAHRHDQHVDEAALQFCTPDSNRERTGCRGGCQCAMLERCYPKFRTATVEHTDIGVCNPAVAVLVFMSILIIGNSVACMVVLRVFFQWRERIRTMMESGYHPEEAPVDPRMLQPSSKTFLVARSQNAPTS